MSHVRGKGVRLAGLMWKPEEKRQLRRPNTRWENNIEMGLKKIAWEGVEWIYLAHNKGACWAVVNTVMNIHAP
jgi:hypothetical protein